VLEIVPIAGMVFSLLLALIIGGFVLMYPLSKRLGQLIELRLEERRHEREGTQPAGEVERLLGAVEALQREVAGLAERQEFTERLLGSGGSDPAQAAGPDAPGRPGGAGGGP
jgi:hypothetical protein